VSVSVGKQCQERRLEIPEFGENMCLQKGEECSWGPIKINEKSNIDNDISHEFDLQMFLTVRDILSDGQFD